VEALLLGVELGVGVGRRSRREPIPRSPSLFRNRAQLVAAHEAQVAQWFSYRFM